MYTFRYIAWSIAKISLPPTRKSTFWEKFLGVFGRLVDTTLDPLLVFVLENHCAESTGMQVKFGCKGSKRRYTIVEAAEGQRTSYVSQHRLGLPLDRTSKSGSARTHWHFVCSLQHTSPRGICYLDEHRSAQWPEPLQQVFLWWYSKPRACAFCHLHHDSLPTGHRCLGTSSVKLQCSRVAWTDFIICHTFPLLTLIASP